MRKLSLSSVVTCVAVLFLALVLGCPNPTSPPSGTSTFVSGKLIDAVTGGPIAGAKVYFSSYTGTSAGGGSFTLDLGKQTGTVSGGFGWNAAGYIFGYVNPISVDPGSNAPIVLPLAPTDTTGYPTHTVTVILENAGTEILNGTGVSIEVTNSNGGFWMSPQMSYTSGGVSFQSPTFGSDCFVYAHTQFRDVEAMADKVDLSSPNPPTLTLSQTSRTAVSVTGNAIGDSAGAILVTPYGPARVAEFGFSSSTTVSVDFANPGNYPCYWDETEYLKWRDVPPNLAWKSCERDSSPTAVQSSIVLPTIDTSVGPDQASAPDATTENASIKYSAGTLSMNAVTGANLYIFGFPTSSGAFSLVCSNDASVVLPSWLTNLLAGKTVTTIAMPVSPASSTALSSHVFNKLLSQLHYSVSPADFVIVAVRPGGGFYSNVLTF